MAEAGKTNEPNKASLADLVFAANWPSPVFPPKGSMWRRWSTRISASQFGMWVARTRFGLFGDTTSRIPKVWHLTCPGTGMGWLGVSKECDCHSWLWVVNPGPAVAPVGGRRRVNVGRYKEGVVFWWWGGEFICRLCAAHALPP